MYSAGAPQCGRAFEDCAWLTRQTLCLQPLLSPGVEQLGFGIRWHDLLGLPLPGALEQFAQVALLVEPSQKRIDCSAIGVGRDRTHARLTERNGGLVDRGLRQRFAGEVFAERGPALAVSTEGLRHHAFQVQSFLNELLMQLGKRRLKSPHPPA